MFSTGVKIPYTLNTPSSSPPQDHLSLLHHPTNIHLIRQVHALMIKSDQTSDSFSAAKLLHSYSLSDPSSAEKLFLSLPWHPSSSSFACNTAIRAHLNSNDPLQSILLFLHLLHHDFSPDAFTFSLLLKSATKLPSFSLFLQTHSQILKRGLFCNTHLHNKLIHGYLLAGEINNARKVFDESPERDSIAYNIMLQGYASAGDGDSLISLFKEISAPDVISWNTLISFFSGRLPEIAISAFRAMQVSGVEPDKVTLIGVLSAIGYLGALDHGKWVHGIILRRKIEMEDNLLSALISMYAKCGSVEFAAGSFEAAGPLRCRVDVWNSMLSALVAGGFSGKALSMFSAMREAGVSLDEITFSLLLSACNHGGMVEEGEEVFRRMGEFEGVERDVGHYGIMIDMYSRMGMMERVEEMVGEMPMEADSVVWRSVLWGSWRHGGERFVELGLEAGRRLVEMEREDHGAYVMVCNLLAGVGRWEDVGKVRREMRRRKVRKVPGCSSIMVDGAVHEFIAGD